MMVSLAELWRSFGVSPAAVAGHSQGEIAAACVAGALTLDDAARVVALRSRMAARLAGTGGMLSVGLPLDGLEPYLAERRDQLTVAVVNSRTSTVLSGSRAALRDVRSALVADGVRARVIRVDYASHSAHVEAIRDELLAALAGVAQRPAQIPFISAMTGQRLPASALTGEYWYRGMRQPVRFDSAMTTLLGAGHRSFMEMSRIRCSGWR